LSWTARIFVSRGRCLSVSFPVPSDIHSVKHARLIARSQCMLVMSESCFSVIAGEQRRPAGSADGADEPNLERHSKECNGVVCRLSANRNRVRSCELCRPVHACYKCQRSLLGNCNGELMTQRRRRDCQRIAGYHQHGSNGLRANSNPARSILREHPASRVHHSHRPGPHAVASATGKACGNSCISRRYTCRQPPGCACNG
jgi:hypothetical protein